MRYWIMLATGVFILAASAQAQLVPAGNEFQVNTYTTGYQGPQAVAENGQDFVVVWDSESGGILAQRFDSLGMRLGSEFQVTNDGAGPAVARDSSGGFTAVWVNNGADGNVLGVFGRSFDSLGTARGSEFQVNTYTTNNQYLPAIGPDGGGGFVVAWQNRAAQDGSDRGVFAQRLSSMGTLVGSEFQVNTFNYSVQGYPAVGSDGNAGFVIAWESKYEDGSSTGIFAQRFASSGLPRGSEFQVNTYTTGTQASPDIEPLDGGFVVVWMGGGNQDGDDYGIFGQRFESTGSPRGTEFLVNTYTVGRQFLRLGTSNNTPSFVANDGSGGFLVVWSSQGQDGDSGGVFAQLFDSSGMRSGSELQVNTYTTDRQEDGAVSGNGAGAFTVVWNSYDQDGDSGGVFARRFVIAQPDGESCSETAQCQSMNCVDGVCCNDPCAGAMEACNVAGMVGTCSPTLPMGDSCTDDTQCESTSCADGVCCNDPCTGALQACNVTGMIGTCSPTLPNGDTCADDTLCDSSVCAGSVCCDRACPGPAFSCDLPGSVGTCTALAAPAPLVSPWAMLVIFAGLVLIAFAALRRTAS